MKRKFSHILWQSLKERKYPICGDFIHMSQKFSNSLNFSNNYSNIFQIIIRLFFK